MLPSVDEVLSQKEIEELIEKYPRSIVLESIREVIDKNRQTIVAIKTEELPSVDEVLSQKEIEELIEKYPRSIVLESIREVIDKNRQTIVAIKTEEEAEKFSLTIEKVIEETERKARDNYALSLKKVINGTGTVLHTNLGRSLISEKIKDEIWTAASRYSNLEYDLEKGERGSRYVHLTDMIKRLTGAEDVLVVNNNAAAVMLVLYLINIKKKEWSGWIKKNYLKCFLQ